MAYIEKRKNGYLVRVVLGYDGDGKRIVKNTTYHPQSKTERAQLKEVKDFADDLERKVKNGEFYNIQELTLNDFFKQWKEDIAPLSLTESKREYYEDVMEKQFLKDLGYKDISKIRSCDLQKIVTRMVKEGLKPATIRTYFSVISSIMSSAYDLELIKDNPVKRIKRPKEEVDGKEHTFTVEQSRAFLKALDNEYMVFHKGHERTLQKTGERYTVPSYYQTVTVSTMWKAYFTLALFSGARRGELVSLTWNDIDFENCTISITKGTALTKNGQIIKDPKTRAGIRDIKLPFPVFIRLKEWRNEQEENAISIGEEWKGYIEENYDCNYVFTQTDGKQLNLATPTHKLKEILALYNSTVPESEKLPDIRLHDLRHCTASLLIANGADIASVSRMLGHSQISMTLDRYTHSLKTGSEVISNKLAELLNTEDQHTVNLYQA